MTIWKDQETGSLYEGACRVGDSEATPEDVEAWELLRNPPPTKEQQIAAVLNALPGKPARLQVQLTVQLGELTAVVQAPAYGMTTGQALAYVYQKNPAYRRAKDAEIECIAIEAAS